jgi:hypothetical protein
LVCRSDFIRSSQKLGPIIPRIAQHAPQNRPICIVTSPSMPAVTPRSLPTVKPGLDQPGLELRPLLLIAGDERSAHFWQSRLGNPGQGRRLGYGLAILALAREVPQPGLEPPLLGAHHQRNQQDQAAGHEKGRQGD